jgi:MFS family permease
LPVLFLSVVLDLVGFGIVLPLLPFYALRYGASPLAITLLAATFSFAQFAAAPLWGRLSDRIGRRPVLLAGFAVSASAYFWLALAESLTAIFLARALSGVGAGKIAIAQAIVADRAPPDRLARDMGRIGAAFGIGMVLGPALGGALTGSSAAPNYHLPALAAAAASAIALAFAYFMVGESLPPERRTRSHARPERGRRWPSMTGFGALLRRPRLAGIVAMFFVVNLIFSQVEAVFPLWLNATFGWGSVEVGIVFTFIGVVVAGMQGTLIGPLAHWLGEWRVALLAIAAIAIGMLLTPLVAGTGTLALTLLLIASGVAASGPSMTTMASRSVDGAGQGAALGTAQSAAALGRVVGPGIAGWQFTYFDRNAPYLVGGMILLAACAAMIAARRRYG